MTFPSFDYIHGIFSNPLIFFGFIYDIFTVYDKTFREIMFLQVKYT